MGIKHFLSSLKATLRTSSRVLFVSGNESCDMDSFTTALMTSYLCSTLDKTSPFDCVSPLINIPKDDLSLRGDIMLMLEKLGIDADWLVYLNELDSYPTSAVFMVDWNRLTTELSRRFDNNVYAIIDHHEDEHFYENLKGPRVIERCGSCSALALNYYLIQQYPEKAASLLENDSDLVTMGFAPLLLDTGDMNQKVETFDRQTYDLLATYLRSTPAITNLYVELNEKKKDVSALSAYDILRKDYKEWDGPLKVGISSTVKSIVWLEENRPDIDDEMKRWAGERKLDLYCVMSSSKKSGIFVRYLAFYASNEQVHTELDKFIKDYSTQLQLIPMAGLANDIRVYQMHKTENSRKQIAPLLRKAFQGEGADDSENAEKL